MSDELMSIIMKLNGEQVIHNQNLMDASKKLGLKNTLLIAGNCDKYYYFSDFGSKEGENSLSSLEEEILFCNNIEIVPRKTYLVLFYEVEEINETVFKKIIEIEENEYFYKKYMFYFTRTELRAFTNWYAKMGSPSADTLINNGYIHENMTDIEVQFLLRLLIKVPIIKYKYKKAELSDFDSIFSSKISKGRGTSREVLMELNNEILLLLSENERELEISVNEFYEKHIGGLNGL